MPQLQFQTTGSTVHPPLSSDLLFRLCVWSREEIAGSLDGGHLVHLKRNHVSTNIPDTSLQARLLEIRHVHPSGHEPIGAGHHRNDKSGEYPRKCQ